VLLAELKEAVVNGDMDEVEVLCNRVLEEKFNPVEAVQNGLIKGIEELGKLWTEGEMFLPDVMMGADTLKLALDILGPELAKAEAEGIKRDCLWGWGLLWRAGSISGITAFMYY
jgi:trimethylamine corrinoid protein